VEALTAMSPAECEVLADAFFAALEEGSVQKVLACYAPDARIWHNFDQVTLTPAENVAGLEQLFGGFPKRRYVDVRRIAAPGGLVQQHVLQLERVDAVRIDWPGCIVFQMAGGRITSLEEYVDIASLSAGSA
jgi:uncharacterized protein